MSRWFCSWTVKTKKALALSQGIFLTVGARKKALIILYKEKNMFVVLLTSLIMGLLLTIGAIYNIYGNGFNDEALLGLIMGVVLFLAAAVWGIEYGKSIGRVNGLVESGKYEVVTNNDYSMKELETFLKINDTYLKELSEE